MSDVRVGLQITGETSSYERALASGERALRDAVAKQNIELQRLRNSFQSSMKAASEFTTVGIKPLADQLGRLSSYELPKANIEIERFSKSTKEAHRATVDQAIGLKGSKIALEQYTRSTKESRDATVEQILAIGQNVRELHAYERSVMSAVAAQKELQGKSDDVTRVLAMEALAAEHTAKNLTEKERASLKAAVAQKVLSEEAEKTARKLLLEAEAADIDAHALARRESSVLDNVRSNQRFGNWFQGFQRTLVAVGVAAATIGIGPVSAAVADLGVAALAAGAGLVSLSGALAGVASAMGGFVQIMAVFKASGISEVFQSLGQSGDKLRQTLNGLSPPARAFALQLREVAGTVHDLEARVGGALFPGLTAGLEKAAPVLSIIKDTLVATASAMGQVGRDAGALFGTKDFQANLRAFGSINAAGVRGLGDSLLNLLDAFLRIEHIATPLIKFMQRGMVDASKAIDDYTKNHGKGLTQFFNGTITTLKIFFGILQGIGGILKGTFTAVLPVAQEMGRSIERTLGGWAKVIQSPGGQNTLKQFFESAKAPLDSFLNAVGALGEALGNLAAAPGSQQGVTKLFNDIRTLLIPALAGVANIFQRLTPNILNLLSAVLHIIKDLVPGLKPLEPLAAFLLDAATKIAQAVDTIIKVIPGGATAVDAGIVALLARGQIKNLMEKIKGTGGVGAIWGSRGPEAPGSPGNPISVIGEMLGGGGGLGGGGAGGETPAGGIITRGKESLKSGLKVAGARIVRAVGIGLVAVPVGDFLGNQVGGAGGQAISGAAGGAAAGSVLGLPGAGVGAVLGALIGPGLASEGKRQAAREKQTIGNFESFLPKLNAGNLAQQLDAMKTMRDSGFLTRKEFKALETQFKAIADVRFTFGTAFSKEAARVGSVNKKVLADVFASLDTLPAEARKQASNAMIEMAAMLESQGKLPKGSTTRLHDEITNKYKGMKVESVKHAQQMAAGVSDSINGLNSNVGTGMKAMTDKFNAFLSSMGVKPISFDKSGFAKGIPKLSPTPPTKARGGWVGGGQRGTQGPDNTLINAYEGEAFLNHPQQPYANLGLAVTKAMGMQPYGSLGELFSGTGGAMAGGGFVKGKVSTFGPPLEASGVTAYGKSSADPGIALNPTGDSSGWNGSLAQSFKNKWFRTQVGEGAANLQVIDKGPNANGRKIDVTGAGSLKLGIPPSHFPTDSIGMATEVSGPGDTQGGSKHSHKLPAYVLVGPAGLLKTAGQAELNKAHSAMQGYLDKKTPDAVAGSDFGAADVSMYAFPLANFAAEERVDRGQDMRASKPYSPTLALGPGHVDTAVTGFPGVQLTLSSGPAKGQQVFYGHTAKDYVSAGQTVTAGQHVGATGGDPEAGIENAGHTEIGFMPGYYSQTGSWQGPGSRGGMMMHNLLHHGWPGKIGARAMMASGGFVGRAVGGLAAAAKKVYHPPKHKDKQYHGKHARTVPWAARILKNLGEPNIQTALTRVNTMENRISDREGAFQTLQGGYDRTQEESMVTLSDADLAAYQGAPDVFKNITGFNIGDFQAGDQVPNVKGGVFGRYFGAAPGDATRAPRGGAFVRGVNARVAEINVMLAQRQSQAAMIKAARHLHSVIIGRANRAIKKRRERMNQIRRRVEKNMRRLAVILKEIRSIQGAKLDQALKNALSKQSIARRRADIRTRRGELAQELADEQHFQHDQPADQRDSTHIWRLQDELRGLSASDAIEASLQSSSGAVHVAHLNKVLHGLRGQAGSIEHENRLLTGTGGDNMIMGHGGAWGTLNTQYGNLQTTIRDNLVTRHGDDVAGGDVATTIQGFRDELASYRGLSPIMPRDIAAATTTDTDAALKALYQQQLQETLKNLAVSQAEFGVFAGFNPLLQQRLVGSFERGGLIPETGLALVHAGEHISPSPEGPYGSQIVAQGGSGDTSVVMHMHGDASSLVKLIDARINDQAPRMVSENLGRRQRLIQAARPGRR